jgi:hypothetical protein
MRRFLSAVAFVATAATLLGPRSARAQVKLYFNAPGDTAHAAVPGAETRIQVRAKNPYWYGYYYYGYPYITYAKATFVYDATKIQVLGVQGSSLSNVSATPGPGTLTVIATGYAYGTDQMLYSLRVKLLPGVTDGTYLWIKGDSADVYQYYYYYGGFRAPALGAIGQVCHATQSWGDVDGDGQVDSRDALITLSAAVGLPVSGFNLARGDVDADGLTNSRDALLMLSYSIGLDVGTSRVGDGVLDACPGLTAPGDTVVFSRNDAPAGLYTLGASSTVPVQFTAGAPTLAHLAADGKTVAYECSALGHVQVCRINTDGTGSAQLTADAGTDNGSPDWSPAGDSIVWLHGGVIWKMAANGSGQVQVGASPIVATDVHWGRTATKLAYANGTLHVVNTDGTNDVTVPTIGISSGINGSVWSPAGDSLGFVVSGDPRGWVVPVGGGTPGIIFSFAGNVTGGDWGTHGVIISLDTGSGPPSLWVMRGVNGPIFRVTSPHTFDGAPAWRRTP